MLLKLVLDLIYGSESPFTRAVRGIRIGVTSKEIGIAVDTITNVYGEVFFNLETGKLRFNFPEVLVNNKAQYISKMKAALVETRYLRNFSSTIFLLTLAYFARRAFIYYRRNKTLDPTATLKSTGSRLPSKNRDQQV